jgi:hypothetical protein
MLAHTVKVPEARLAVWELRIPVDVVLVDVYIIV